jgi:hypothetical protein
MKLIVRVGAVLVSCAAVALSGCLAATAGAVAAAGAYAYERGELRSTIDAPLDDVYRAAMVATEQLQLPVVDRAKDAFAAHLTARQIQGGDVRIDLTRESDNLTRIGVRVGTFGDEAKSRLILQRIRDAL